MQRQRKQTKTQEEKIKKQIGRNFANLRWRQELTQEKLSELIDIDVKLRLPPILGPLA